MLLEQTIDKLNQMKLFGMVSELDRQLKMQDISHLSFEERFSLIVDVEAISRENRKLKRLLSNARLRENACIEDIDFRVNRGLDKGFILSLANCSWIEKHLNAIIVGPTGWVRPMSLVPWEMLLAGAATLLSIIVSPGF